MAVHSRPEGWPDTAVVGFDWDAGNRAKCEKHGVSIAAIEAVFHDEVAVFPDSSHSLVEERLKAIGSAPSGRRVFVVFTLRRFSDGTRIRPISARYMHRKEVEYFEAEIAKSGQR